MVIRRFSVVLALLLAGTGLGRHALALDFFSVAEPAVLYDAPSNKAQPKFVVLRDTPLEMVVTVGAWVKVRDQDGDLTWIEKSRLSSRRTVIVRSERAQIRSTAADTAAPGFEAERHVVLELLEAGPAGAPGWARVRHKDGQSGFVRANQVWGL